MVNDATEFILYSVIKKGQEVHLAGLLMDLALLSRERRNNEIIAVLGLSPAAPASWYVVHLEHILSFKKASFTWLYDPVSLGTSAKHHS
ncbi:unnamed protein product [Fusarium venenatum]|uniref:Uncharacterized protein n=1 Tax=Fusarium venenatum TaxID=56646 RepID=A0A2L2TJX6_9HYPO|nr:uncharacterized protein FVRRES_07812 [Fusarium venenatum]CEI63376.1 unnamed protein product [Fusarium venenatum]